LFPWDVTPSDENVKQSGPFAGGAELTVLSPKTVFFRETFALDVVFAQIPPPCPVASAVLAWFCAIVEFRRLVVPLLLIPPPF
jgi:hypothetical protein